MPTAYLSPSLLQDLTNVSVSPGAGNTGYPLVWNNTSGRFELVVLGVAGGGTGTSNGSITGTGALTFTAGGTNQDINLNPSGGSGAAAIKNNLRIAVGGNSRDGLNLVTADSGFATLGNGSSGSSFIPFFWSEANFSGVTSLGFQAQQFGAENNSYAVMAFIAAAGGGGSPIAGGNNAFGFFNGASNANSLLRIVGNGDSTFYSTTESTSTTTGAVRIDGGLGVAKNVNIGGNLRFAGGTVPATAASAGTTGDIRYDGSHLYICTATNTWVRTALSTW